MSLLLKLPDEVLYHVLEYLSRDSLLQFCRLCKDTEKWLLENKLWLSRIMYTEEILEYIRTLPYPLWKVVLTLERIKKCKNLYMYHTKVDNLYGNPYVYNYLYDYEEKTGIDSMFKIVGIPNRSLNHKFLVKQCTIVDNGREMLIKGNRANYKGKYYYIRTTILSEDNIIPFLIVEYNHVDISKIVYSLSDIQDICMTRERPTWWSSKLPII